MIRLENIDTYYGTSHVIQGLSLNVEAGAAVSILGRNGVGKTTTLRSIMGLTPPKAGKVFINDQAVRGWPPHKIAGLGVAYVPAERHIFPDLTVEENLKLAEARSDQAGAWNLERVYEYFPVLGDRRRSGGTRLSGGEQQMLAIGRALMGNPSIMLLDEPSQGLSPILVAKVAQIVSELCKEHGITLLLVEQNFRIALAMADRHYLMGTKSKIQGEVSSAEIIKDQELIKRTLAV
ncbi:MAG: ABC transporter ATP-binding protein [Thermodesulfobacteriota bacterium]